MGFFSWNQKRKSNNNQGRALRLEVLEDRRMLSVSALEYSEIRAAYSSLNLPSDMAEINIIEIESSNLSVESLNAALESAYKESNIYYGKKKDESNPASERIIDDLILVRTTSEINTVTYASATEYLNLGIDAAICGAVTLVAWGDAPLTVNAAEQSSALVLNKEYLIENDQGETLASGTSVARAGAANLVLTGGQSALGAGVYLVSGSALTMEDCLITENSAEESGGGIYLSGGSVFNTHNVTISKNTAQNSGGGIYAQDGYLEIAHSSIVQNTASMGAGIYDLNASVKIRDAFLTGNQAKKLVSGSVAGGGIVHLLHDTPASFTPLFSMINCVVADNASQGYGGGIVTTGDTILIHNTIARNTASGSGGGLTILGGNIQIYNCILAENAAQSYPDLYKCNGTVSGFEGNVSNNGVSGNTVYNSALPLFADAENGDYRLAPDSQAIDVGNYSNSLLGEDNLPDDITGWSRLVGSQADAGAYEARGNSQAVNIKKNSENQLVYSLDLTLGTITESLIASPQNGTVSINKDTGEIFYSPRPDYLGLDSFVFQIELPTGETALYGLTISILEDVETALNITPVIQLSKNAASILTPSADGLPVSEKNVNEWTPFIAELWANSSDVQSNTEYKIQLTYNSRVSVPTAVIQPNGVIYENYEYSSPDENGVVTLTITVVYDSSYKDSIAAGSHALLGEVSFQPAIFTASDDVDFSTLGVSAVSIYSDSAISVNGQSAGLDIWAVPYDMDDNGYINLDDFIQYALRFQAEIEPHTLSDAADYTGDAYVGLDDFIQYALHFDLNYKSTQEFNVPRMKAANGEPEFAPLPAQAADAVFTQLTDAAQTDVAEGKIDEEEIPEVQPLQSISLSAVQFVYDVQSPFSIKWLWKKDRLWGESYEE